jgi:hypothetical protein
MKIGLLADSSGDIDALDRGTQLLLDAGAERLFFLGGRFPDVDALFTHRRQKRRGHDAYSDQDFVDDVAAFLGSQARPGTRGTAVVDEVEKLRRCFSRVPCKESLEYRDPTVPKKLVEMVGETLACLVHDKADLIKDDMLNAVLLMHGKSPEPNVVQIGPRYFVTPGRLTGASEQTCALLTLTAAELRFQGFTLEGQAVKTQSFARGSSNKISAK